MSTICVIRAVYTVPEDESPDSPKDLGQLEQWLTSIHYDDLRRAGVFPTFFNVSGRDQTAQVIMVVPGEMWNEYATSSPDRVAISREAKKHGFTSIEVLVQYASFSDDDGSPYGGNPESERGFNGESRG